jgi:hypothetical protein
MTYVQQNGQFFGLEFSRVFRMAGFKELTNAVGWLAIRSNALLASRRPW